MDVPNQRIDSHLIEVPDEVNLLKYVAGINSGDIDRYVDISRNPYTDPTLSRSKSLTDYFYLLDSVFRSNINTTSNTPHTRNQRYEIYDEMDESTAYISSALDIMSDDATQADEDGVIIHIKSESDKVNNIIADFIEDYDLEDRLSKWTRAVAKYGDLFVKVDGAMGKGVTYINDTIYPGIIDRRDINGKLVAFANNQSTVYSNTDLYAPWEFVHFRHKGDIYKEESKQARLGLVDDHFDKSLTSAYGQSILRPAIKVYAQLRFVENMILLSRLTNSVRRNVFLINVGDVAPDKAFDSIASYANVLKKDINLNIEDGIYSSARHTINYDEDIFIPVGDPQNDVRIEQIGGDYNIREAYDLEYLLNKLFSALKVPKAYLNYEQDLNARSTLIQLDIRYARSVSQLQHTMVSGLRRLINIHLAYKGLDPSEFDLDVTLTPVSSIDEEARMNQRQIQVGVARDMFDLLDSMRGVLEEGESKEKMDLQPAIEHIMSTYLDFNQGLIDKVFGRKQEEETPKLKIYSGADIHAAYPTTENQQEYEKLRETIIADQKKDINK